VIEFFYDLVCDILSTVKNEISGGYSNERVAPLKKNYNVAMLVNKFPKRSDYEQCNYYLVAGLMFRE